MAMIAACCNSDPMLSAAHGHMTRRPPPGARTVWHANQAGVTWWASRCVASTLREVRGITAEVKDTVAIVRGMLTLPHMAKVKEQQSETAFHVHSEPAQ